MMMIDDNEAPEEKRPRDYFLRMYVVLLCVMLGLLLLYIVPSQIGSWWDIKRIDMLSDLRQTEGDGAADLDPLVADAEGEGQTDLPRAQVQSQQEKKRQQNEKVYDKIVEQTAAQSAESSTASAVLIEDYSPERSALKHFFEQLRRRESLGRPVRIAVLGDSFIEGDIFTDAVRQGLQERYGGGGVGLVPMASAVAGFRQSVRHEQKGWREVSQMDKAKRQHIITGHLFDPTDGARAGYRIPDGAKPFSLVTLYYTSPTDARMRVTIGDDERTVSLDDTGGSLRFAELYDGAAVSQARLTLDAVPSGFVSYGVALEQATGVTLDNMSLRGSSGLHLGSLDESLNRDFAKARPYDLIVLEYGLNVANAKQKSYKGYVASLRKSILHLRSIYPQADILLLGVSDRAQKGSGALRTMPAVEQLEQDQRELAKSLGVAYFSLLDAMRSLGGIVEMSSRGEAAKDYTHLSHKGGQRLAPVFLSALALEQKYYDEIR